ncbi:MAG: cryptochrome/photolyase family protein [Acidobacteriota bacterium]
MSVFRSTLAQINPSGEGRRWLFIPYDQLSDRIGPLHHGDPRDLGIVVVESSWKGERRPYHQQKLALILANLRHFALEQARRGVAVLHLSTELSFGDSLQPVIADVGSLTMMEAAERELRADLAPLVEVGAIEVVPHEGWLTSTEQFEQSNPKGPPWRMDAFYRQVRRDTDLLMKDGKPVGGKYSFDSENREAWAGEPEPPKFPTFEPDEITLEVGELVRDRFDHHPGTLHLETLPASKDDAETLWKWALRECIPTFGPYEDAMSHRSIGLFHTRISQLLNLCRLLAGQVVGDVAETDAPLASREGFIRQVLGWREFVRHVHCAADGFRNLLDQRVEASTSPGDGGWSGWAGNTWTLPEAADRVDGGAAPSFLEATHALPVAFWGTSSGLECLDRVVAGVWSTGYGHHITRLMVLGNLATLLAIAPRQLTDWFWAAYVDAYDWVVEPNVLGMATYALGDLMTTKPYVSGAAYIHRMSDFCDGCRFDPKKNCPITRLYWAFLARHRKRLAENPRMNLVLGSLRKRSAENRDLDQRIFDIVTERLGDGAEIRLEDLEARPPSDSD